MPPEVCIDQPSHAVFRLPRAQELPPRLGDLACQDYGAAFASSAGVALGSEGFSAVVAGAS
jgi:hypothetical protein